MVTKWWENSVARVFWTATFVHVNDTIIILTELTPRGTDIGDVHRRLLA